MSGPDVEGVLAAHVFYNGGMTVDGWQRAACSCGRQYDNPNASQAWSHPRHVAAELRAEVRAWLESDDALYVAARRESDGLMSALAALAEQVGQVASVGEGEG